MKRATDFGWEGRSVCGGDELPKVHWVAKVLMGSGWKAGVQGDDGGSALSEVQSDGVFSSKPFGSLTWTSDVLNHTSHERGGQSQDEGAAVLEDVASVGRDAVGDGHFLGSADGEFD